MSQYGDTNVSNLDEASHPGLFSIKKQAGDFNSYLISDRNFSKGDIICHLKGLTKAPKAYSSVQCGVGENDHVELNSDLLYVNHSCEPNIHFDVSSPNMEDWHVRAARDIESGEILTFFYPSTEWVMEQPFECRCGTKTCLRVIRGAKFLTVEELSKHSFINPHIWQLKGIQEGAKV